MDASMNWSEELLETLISEGPEITLSIITGNGPIHSGPVGLLWDDASDSLETLMLAQTLAGLGRNSEAIEALELVAQYQWARSEAA